MENGIIRRIEISRLYNQFTYTLTPERDLPSAAILYGDNGVGKSTILRLVFHLLSPANNRGHRTAIRLIQFETLSVTLNNGVRVIAERKLEDGRDYQTIPINFRIEVEGKLVAEWMFNHERSPNAFYITNEGYRHIDMFLAEEELRRAHSPKSVSEWKRIWKAARIRERESDGVKRGEEGFLEVLKAHAPTVFNVNAERRLESDAVADPNDELELRRAISSNEPKRLNELVARARDIALSQAMLSASRWIQRRGVQSANRGSTNVHSVYVAVLGHLSNDYNRDGSSHSASDISQLIRDLKYIELRTKQLEEYELSNALDMSIFSAAINSSIKQQREIC